MSSSSGLGPTECEDGSVPAQQQKRRPSLFAYVIIGLILGLALLVGVFALVPDASWRLAAAVSDRHAFYARVYHEALGGGDARQSYSDADERFRQAYEETQVGECFTAHPELLQVPTSVSINQRAVDGQLYWSVSFNDEKGARTEVFVLESDGKLRLIGISPHLIDAIPKEVANFDMGDSDLFGGDVF